MKTIKLITTTIALFCAVNASAQFMNTPATQESTRSKRITTSSTNDYSSRIYVSYDMPKLNLFFADDGDYLYMDCSGFSVGYDYSLSIPKISGFNFDLGFAISYARYNEVETETTTTGETAITDSGSSYTTYASEYEYTTSLDWIMASLPISLSYSLNLSDNISISPYFGFVFRYGLALTLKEAYNSSSYYDDDTLRTEEYDRYSYNMYSEMSGISLKRFSLGYQVGVNIDIKRIFVGLNYSDDFTNLSPYKDYNYKFDYNKLSVRVGYKF